MTYQPGAQGQQPPVIDELPPDRRTNLPNGASVYSRREASWFMAVDGVLHPYVPKSGRGRLIVVLSVFAAIIITFIAVVVVRTIQKGPMFGGSTPNSNFTVGVTACTADPATGVATVEVMVINRSDRTRSAILKVEYRDSSGARLDTDTVYVRNIAAGDTARSQESTFLDAPPAGSIACRITEVS